MTTLTDTQRLDWLEAQEGSGLISDDNGHWAVSGDGAQNVPCGVDPEGIWTTLWRNSVREAIDAAIAREEEAEDA